MLLFQGDIMDIRLQKIKRDGMEYITVKGKDMSDKNPTPPSFHCTCWHTNNQQHKKASQLSPSLEVWAILAPLQNHLIPFKPNKGNGDRDPPSHHLHSWVYRKRGHCWLRTVPTADNNSSTFKMCHQGEQSLAGRSLMLCYAMWVFPNVFKFAF